MGLLPVCGLMPFARPVCPPPAHPPSVPLVCRHCTLQPCSPLPHRRHSLQRPTVLCCTNKFSRRGLPTQAPAAPWLGPAAAPAATRCSSPHTLQSVPLPPTDPFAPGPSIRPPSLPSSTPSPCLAYFSGCLPQLTTPTHTACAATRVPPAPPRRARQRTFSDATRPLTDCSAHTCMCVDVTSLGWSVMGCGYVKAAHTCTWCYACLAAASLSGVLMRRPLETLEKEGAGSEC